jgi:Prealbumin-like fold domain
MTYQTAISRFSAGRIALALLATLAILTVYAFSMAAPVAATDEGEGGEGNDDAALNILKFVEGTETRLPGAVFEIEGIGTYTTDENGQICILGLPHDTEWLVREIQAPEGYEIIPDQAEQMVEVDDDGSGLCDSPDAVFYNRPVEGGEEETVSVSIMKHLCADVANVADFVAIEAAATAASDNPFAALAATVLACPTIVLTGDVPTAGAVTGGNVDFDFSVVDADGTKMLSVDGAFMGGQLCESDIDLILVDNDADDCLDTSHYSFEAVNGTVTITETAAPAAHRFGTLRFTPGSGDEAALQGTIASVEASGVIQLDTTVDADGSIMLHVYNFTTEGTQGGNPRPTPREGTQGGTLPDTGIEAVSSGPAAIAGAILLMVIGLASAATYATVRARRR